METLVTVDWLCTHRDEVVVADVRWRPAPKDAGRRAFFEGHIPGAVYLDLDDDLAEVPADPRVGGRHPLPPAEAFCTRLCELGIGSASRVVCCDDMGGAIAARLWWMLRWVGHRDVSVLDGGLAAWTRAGHEIETGDPRPRDRATSRIAPRPDDSMIAVKRDVEQAIASERPVLDARSFERYRGENETIDPVGGHIAGAISAPYSENLSDDGTFRAATALRDRFRRLGVAHARDVICHCGSGVTACHNILAMELAGLGTPRLYVGSWSEWSRDPHAPKAIGPRP